MLRVIGPGFQNKGLICKLQLIVEKLFRIIESIKANNMELIHPRFQRITINPQVCFGKPCIRGMRFPVTTLIGYLASGMSMEEILKDFPFLELEDILQALSFSALATEDKFIPLIEKRA